MASAANPKVCSTWEATQLSQTTCVKCGNNITVCICVRSGRKISPSIRNSEPRSLAVKLPRCSVHKVRKPTLKTINVNHMETSTKPSEPGNLELDFSAFNYCSNEATPAQLSNLAGFLEGFMGLNQNNTIPEARFEETIQRTLNSNTTLDDSRLIAYFAEELQKDFYHGVVPLTEEDVKAFFLQSGSLSS